MIRYLCKQRAKIAKKRSKDHLLNYLSKDKKYNYHNRIKKQAEHNKISLIMPPRRLWVRPSCKKRYRKGSKMNSIDKNALAMLLTIKKHINEKTEYNYLKELNIFIDDISKSINGKTFKFRYPQIRPEPKDRGGTICRPIASFRLKDNLINCLTNKYLVHYLDDLFYENSFAFRAERYFGDEKRVPTHHDAFKKIVDYLNKNVEKKIYVAECDMKKFYDTVNHKIVTKQFRNLCLKLLFKKKCDIRAKILFKRYLQCYNFNEIVLSLNSDKEYWERHKIKDGSFEWVKNEIDEKYKNKDLSFIGIPQGGALSGLIANIVLDYADKKIMKLMDNDILYVRYCDDMIMMHTDKKKCGIALKAYMKALTKLKLFPHKITDVKYSKDFWKSKSKGPYEWSNDEVPWVGFVGYEINRNGEIRIRKRSLKKERNKQKELVEGVINAISHDKIKVSKNTVIESTYRRLNGMAVGRVELWNYTNYENDMCWAKGFNLLNNNKYSRIQVRSLDRSKNMYLAKLFKTLGKIDDSNIKKINKKSNKQHIYYGKPFSYFYQVIEKKGDPTL
ncbi:hypothetical protein FACS1894163_00630 [Spirochaetia bacterium]|nr:hypothetical protein FACS1894163_00630 [Spirochaetia bacterium]